MRHVVTTSTAIVAAMMASPAPALAQAAEPADGITTAGRATIYQRAYFDRFGPSTALDIAKQVPGFLLDTGNNDVRGFTGAAGNVVFNGARPSSKSESLETILARIPAGRVVRVEVGPGSLYGSEYSGKSQVLNVILSAAGGFDGSVTGSVRRHFTGQVVPNLSASALLKRGASSFSVSAGTQNEHTTDEGVDILTDTETGKRIELRRKVNRYKPENPFIAAAWALEQAPDKAIHVNARFQKSTEDFIQINRVSPVGGTERDDRLFMLAEAPSFELGGDISRPLAGGILKFVGLANRRKRDALDTILNRIGDEVVGGVEQGVKLEVAETIGRVNWTRSDLAGFNFEIGGEVALNRLESDVSLFELGPDGDRDRIDLPIDNATVSERRGEVYIKAGRQLSPAMRIDAGLNYELSALKVRGDTQADRSLQFFKPSVTVDWKAGAGWHAQLSVRRTVAQLDFFDFISSAELSNDRVNGGNADLLPQRAWELRATIDRPLWGTGLIKFDAGYDRISLLQDRVLTEEGFDAPGNIGTGTRKFISLAVDAPLQRFGLAGTQLKFRGQLQRTRVDDPISSEERRFSGFFPEWEWNVELRRDIGKFAFGGLISDRDRLSFFRANEIDTNWNGGPYGTAFVEYRPDARTTVTFDADNLLGTQSRRNRLFFDPNRSNPEPFLNERRIRNRHVMFQLTLKRTFGGAIGPAVAATGVARTS